ncbi:MAG TPA: hypothetical protein PKW90_28120, partial [Myxococcota bacterium]|nr:hypothetical protein [Myxococcota bacterium]
MAATFSVRFVSADLLSPKGRVASTFDTQRLEILRTGSGEIPVVENTELPSTPQVYLQIWSVGKIEPRPYGPAAGKGSVPILNLDPHNKNQDRLCANIGGYIQQSEAGYQFVALEPPTRGPGPQRAWMHLHYGGRPGEQ